MKTFLLHIPLSKIRLKPKKPKGWGTLFDLLNIAPPPRYGIEVSRGGAIFNRWRSGGPQDDGEYRTRRAAKAGLARQLSSIGTQGYNHARVVRLFDKP